MNKIYKAFRIFLFTLLILCVAVIVIINGFLNKINRPFSNADEMRQPEYTDEPVKITGYDDLELYENVPNSLPDNPVPETSAETTAPHTEPEIGNTLQDTKNIVNIMLIGQDSRDNDEKGRSDAMILATFNVNDRSIQLTSFMRDLYVQIPGHKDNRLNLSYQLGGIRLLKETIEKNFKIPVDGNIEVDFKGFEKAINDIGGIDVEISTREARYLGYEKAGSVHMDGRQALVYARLRDIGNCDYDRTGRQRKILSASYDSVMKMNPVKVIELLNELLPMITTDMTNIEIIKLAGKVLSIGYTKPETFRVPIEGGYRAEVIRGMEVLKPDLDKNRKALQESLYHKK